MMTSYFNLLKYAATGQASPSMTYYDRMRASTLMGGVVQTLTGQPPLSFKADGTPLISWSMKGNGSQTGTPTPDNLVMPTFCGVRTLNLAYSRIETANITGDGSIVRTTGYDVAIARVENGVVYTANSYVLAFYTDEPVIGSVSYNNSRIVAIAGKPTTFTAPITGYVALRIEPSEPAMLNTGSTALPYEPFGWAEKITCAGQTTPVYLGQTQTVRKIRKLVLTGEETFGYVNSCFTYTFDGKPAPVQPTKTVIFSNAYEGIEPKYRDQLRNYQCCITRNYNQLAIRDDNYTEIADYQSYLAQQYAAGTPVTIWYVLATEQTTIVNEPLCKIGDYADELSSEDVGVSIPTVKGQNVLTVDTPIQPSEMTITFKG